MSVLYELASELLDAAAGVLSDPPARRFVSASTPAADCCPQLTVHAGQLTKTPPLAVGPLTTYESVQLPRMNGWQLIITIFRCSPYWQMQSDQPPSPAALAATASATLTDVWELWQGIQGLVRTGTLFAELGCKAVGIGPATPLADDGGCVGWELILDVEPQGVGAS